MQSNYGRKGAEKEKEGNYEQLYIYIMYKQKLLKIHSFPSKHVISKIISEAGLLFVFKSKCCVTMLLWSTRMYLFKSLNLTFLAFLHIHPSGYYIQTFT